MNIRRISIIIFLASFTGLAAFFIINNHYKTTIVEIPVYNHKNTSTLPNKPEIKSEILNLKSLNLKVPFTPQAPTANWDELHNEACEEAGAIMVAEYFYGNKNIQLDPELVEGQISKLTSWLKEHYGYYLDTTSEETAEMITKNYLLNTELKTNFTAEDIKKALSENKLVLISTNGRLLNNPYYKRPGPLHHMLLVKGFNEKEFITNDSGTKRGLNFPYDFKTIYNAAGDWNHEQKTVDLTQKIAIIVWK